MAKEIQYSEKYFDSEYEYRHVVLPQHISCHLPQGRLLSEVEWRQLGVQQSRGWVHYHIHKPEPHILLFRRPLTHENSTLSQQRQQQAQQAAAQQVAELQHQQQMLQLRMQQQQQQAQQAAAHQQQMKHQLSMQQQQPPYGQQAH